jgi:AraC-like DNA-binding protein
MNGDIYISLIMRYREILPPPALQDFVRFFWVLEQDDTTTQPQLYKLFAEGLPGLVFFHTERYGVINGPSCEHKQFAITGSFKMTGAFLFPYSLPLLFKLPSSELSNSSYHLKTFLGAEGTELEEKIFEAKHEYEIFQLLIEFLVARLKSMSLENMKQFSCIRQVIQWPAYTSIYTLAFQSGISTRQFERNTKHHTGFSPKLFNRLMRFHAALRLPQRHHLKSLTDLAYHVGYCDQSHFIREFKEFTGISPKEYFNLKKENRADTFVAWRD